MNPDVTIVIPYHQARADNGMLETALWSCEMQTVPCYVLAVKDEDGAGAAMTRQAGLEQVTTKWTAFLDSDDWIYPRHIEILKHFQHQTSADYCYSYFTPHDQWEGAREAHLDPLGLFGVEFDNAKPTQTTSTILVRTALAQQVGIREQPVSRLIPGTDLRYGEDFDFTVRCVEAGAHIVHVPHRTWAWRMGLHNTSGLPNKGDALRR